MRLLRARPNYTPEEAEEHNAKTLGLLFKSKPKKKRRAKPQRKEEPIHIAIKNYLESILPSHFIVHHSRNGGMSKAENGRSKAMGTKAGWLDLVVVGEKDVGPLMPLVVPSMWFFEVKDEDGVLSDKQREFIKKLDRLGIPHCVVRSIDEARVWVQKFGLPSREVLAK